MNKMRFEVRAAFVMGVALPALETIRRGINFDNIPAYLDDYLIGAFLLYAARAVVRGSPRGKVLLVAAWAMLCGGFFGSFLYQVRSTAATDVSGFSNGFVIVVKGSLYLLAIAALVRSIDAVGMSNNSIQRTPDGAAD
ncbi:hypothetical protein [Duganella radicis]|uniref:DUF4345 domain-containing protein n=1 Tax=Duganella radicis TaxID=551988 RepID=A0A6L6PLL2_9BURK|nr:hypothetical protein [Duganella radicis]MTV39589.1 hypothetical protein [Duganella radicis]